MKTVWLVKRFVNVCVEIACNFTRWLPRNSSDLTCAWSHGVRHWKRLQIYNVFKPFRKKIQKKRKKFIESTSNLGSYTTLYPSTVIKGLYIEQATLRRISGGSRISGGGATPEPGIIWQDFCRKLYEKERNWTERGRRVSLAPTWIWQCLSHIHTTREWEWERDWAKYKEREWGVLYTL